MSDTALGRFVALFNAERFWDSHEVLEGPWRESRSELYHGLILFASAFVHAQRRNAHGVAAQLAKAESALAPLGESAEGIDLGYVREQAARWRHHAQHQPPADWPGSFPKLLLDG